MKLRTAIPLVPTMLLATACTDTPATAPTAVDGPSASAVAAVPEMNHATLMIEHTVHDPCTAALVDLSGTVKLQRLARALDADRFEIRYSAEPTGVTGRARTGDIEYRVQGAASGVVVTTHRERAVTTADFRVVITSSPGVELGRARVAPQLGVLVAFPVDADGRLLDPVIDGVSFAKGECGVLP